MTKVQAQVLGPVSPCTPRKQVPEFGRTNGGGVLAILSTQGTGRSPLQVSVCGSELKGLLHKCQVNALRFVGVGNPRWSLKHTSDGPERA